MTMTLRHPFSMTIQTTRKPPLQPLPQPPPRPPQVRLDDGTHPDPFNNSLRLSFRFTHCSPHPIPQHNRNLPSPFLRKGHHPDYPRLRYEDVRYGREYFKNALHGSPHWGWFWPACREATQEEPQHEGEAERGAKRRADNVSVGNENYTGSYLRKRRTPNPTTAIILIPYPNPFHDSLRSSQKSPVHQTCVVLLGAYVAFCASDAFGYSGVLTVFFSGVTMSHYAWHSLSVSAQKR